MWSDGFNPTVGFVFSLSFSIRMKFWIRNVTSHRIYIGTVSSFHATNLNPKWCSFSWNHFYTVYWRFLRCKLNLNWKFDAWKVQIPENEKLNLEEDITQNVFFHFSVLIRGICYFSTVSRVEKPFSAKRKVNCNE